MYPPTVVGRPCQCCAAVKPLWLRLSGAGLGWAGCRQVFWNVTLPNIRWGLLYGVILTNAVTPLLGLHAAYHQSSNTPFHPSTFREHIMVSPRFTVALISPTAVFSPHCACVACLA